MKASSAERRGLRRDVCVHAAVPRAPALPPPLPAPMKPPPMKARAAKVRRKVSGDTEHVLARRARVNRLLCDWSWPDPDSPLRVSGFRWPAAFFWVHHRVPSASPRRDHVSFGLGFVVAENLVFDRRGSARCRCLSAARTAGNQVERTTDGQSSALLMQAPGGPKHRPVLIEMHVDSSVLISLLHLC